MSEKHENMVGQEIGGQKGNFKSKKSKLLIIAIAVIVIATLTAIILN